MDERHRQPRDQRQLHGLPILVLRVINDRPALHHRRLSLLAEDDAIGRLPHRRFEGVAQADGALPATLGEERESTGVLLLG